MTSVAAAELSRSLPAASAGSTPRYQDPVIELEQSSLRTLEKETEIISFKKYDPILQKSIRVSSV